MLDESAPEALSAPVDTRAYSSVSDWDKGEYTHMHARNAHMDAQERTEYETILRRN